MRGGFLLPFGDQIDFFRQKLDLPTARWDDIWQEAHDKAFVVAGALKADLLNDLRLAVDKAIAEGTTLETFRKDFKAIVARHGWTGWTGEGSPAGEAWRTRVIYETNLRTSYAAGRYAQLSDPELLKRRPYWRYIHNDEVLNPRPLHKAWGDSGLTLPHDHPFWETHFPPNGWGCRCRVTPVVRPAAGDSTEPPAGWDTPDARGLLPGIDRGWAYAPGRSLSGEIRQFVEDKARKLPPPLAEAFKASAQAIPRPVTVEEFIQAGRAIADTLPDGDSSPLDCHRALVEKLEREVGTSTACRVASRGAGAKLVQQASRLFPDSWTAASDALGPLYVKSKQGARGWHYTETRTPIPGTRLRLQDFGVVPMEQGAGYLQVRTGDLANAVHEYTHRLQAALPELDRLFQELHRQRTAGDPLERLRDITGLNYGAQEFARKDKYVNPYQGKEYSGRPLEVMTMAMEAILGAGDWGDGSKKSAEGLRAVYNNDKEIFDFVVGLLFYWKP